MTAHIGLSLLCMTGSDHKSDQIVFGKQEGLVIYKFFREHILGKNDSNSSEGKMIGYRETFNWSVQTQGYIVSSAFVGGFTMSYPAGLAVDKYSARHILSFAICLLTISSIFFPTLSTFFGAWGSIWSRFVMGIGEAALIPSLNSIVTKWIPTHEKSLAAAILTSGNQVSGMIGNVLVAEICSSTLGWRYIFYSGASFGILWLIIWHSTVRNSPKNTKWIDEKELGYLDGHLLPTNKEKLEEKATPWKDILSSKVFWCLMYSSIVGNMMIGLIFVYIPVYFNDVLRMDVKTNGFFSSIPHASNLVSKIIWGYGMDKLRQEKYLSPTSTVKISQFVSMTGISLSCYYLRYVDSNSPSKALILLSMVSGFFGLSISGFYTSLLSVAPSHIGVITSLGTVIGFIGRAFTPQLISIYRKEGSAEEWGNILLVYTIFCMVAAISFSIFASGDVQEWDRSRRRNLDTTNLSELVHTNS